MIISLRQFKSRKLFAIGALLAVGLLGAQNWARAQTSDTLVVQPDDRGAIETIAAVVQGLSYNDLLNVRATASPIGLVLARIPNGTLLTRLECATSRNTEWCRVEVPELDGLVGWTPARYLHFAGADGEYLEERPASLPVSPVIDPAQITVGILPDPLPMPEDPLAYAPAGSISGGSDLQTVLLAPDVDGPAVLDAAREIQKIDGAAADLTLAYATRSDPASSEVYSAFDGTTNSNIIESADAADAPSVSDLPAVPLPSPRPPREIEAEPSSATTVVAALPLSEAQTDSVPAALAITAPTEQTSPPAMDEAVSGSPAEEDTSEAAPDTPVSSESVSPVVLDASVSAALPTDVPDELAPQSPLVSQPETVETSSQVVASPEPISGQAETDPSEQTLREQLAALLPSWNRPAAQSEPEPVVTESLTTEPPVNGDVASAISEPAAKPAETPAAADLPTPVASSVQTQEPEPAPEPRIVADARTTELPASDSSAGEIPCARYVGQPMARCEVRVARLTVDDADVTVLWPDGGERLIRFRGGQPDSTNTRGEFRFSREAELNLIRIGSGERFEILDALPFAE